MEIYTRLIISVLTLMSLSCFSQDTLVFQKRNDTTKTFNLPLNEFEITIKPLEGKRIRAIITDYNDTIFTIKKWIVNRGTRKEIRKKPTKAKQNMV
jgi:hypothetical protein